MTLAAPAALAGLVERLDYETGSLDQWDSVQAVPGGATIITSPVRQGKYAAKFVVRPGDDPIDSSGTRAEVLRGTGEGEGDESWWAWSTYFPDGWNPDPETTWNTITQWHHTGSSCGVPLTFKADTRPDPDNIRLVVRGGDLDSDCQSQHYQLFVLYDIEKNRWYDHVLHVKWSSDPSVGFVEVWVNGVKVVPKTHAATLYTGQDVYVKQGFYRGDSSLTSEIVHDGLIRGESLADVEFSDPSLDVPQSTASTEVERSISDTIDDGDVLAGEFEWLADPKPDAPVEFFVDGVLVNTEFNRPYGDRESDGDGNVEFTNWNNAERYGPGDHVFETCVGDICDESVATVLGPPEPLPSEDCDGDCAKDREGQFVEDMEVADLKRRIGVLVDQVVAAAQQIQATLALLTA